ncbi:MAG TPA: hypothetical protein VFA18_21135 [Gemmataceae bacterium]|nr:hypothetical protein [Gemmataceae bacterium]
MAPERFRGQCDARADVYGLGLTLHELLTLRPAFDDPDRLRLMEQIGRREPPRPRALNRRIPPDLETIILRATAREPERRYPSAQDLADDLRRFLADRPIQARRSRLPERLWRWCRRNPIVAGLLAMVAVLLASVTAVSTGPRYPLAARGRGEALSGGCRAPTGRKSSKDLLTAAQPMQRAAFRPKGAQVNSQACQRLEWTGAEGASPERAIDTEHARALLSPVPGLPAPIPLLPGVDTPGYGPAPPWGGSPKPTMTTTLPQKRHFKTDASA